MAEESSVIKMSVRDITDLMEDRQDEFLKKLQNFGGIESFCANWILTSPSTGLPNDVTVNARREAYGTNAISKLSNAANPNPPSQLRCFWEGCKSTNILLRLCFIIALVEAILLLIVIILDWSEPAALATLIPFLAPMIPFILSAFLIGLSNYRQGKHFSSLRSQQQVESLVRVTRKGAVGEIPWADLVVGDICWVTAGSQIPADGIRIPDNESQQNIEVARAFAGTRAVQDFKMIVLAVGQNTLEARNFVDKRALPKECFPRKTFTGQLASFSRIAIYTALAFSILLLVILIGRFSVNVYVISGDTWRMTHAQKFVTFVTLAIKFFQLALPELIPFFVVCWHSLDINRLRKKGIQLKDLNTLSKFSSVTTLVLDIESLRNSVTKSQILEAVRNVKIGWTIKILLSQGQAGTDDSISLETEVGESSNIRRLTSLKEKLDFMESLTESGQTVAVVSHDPPVLRAADVGISVASEDSKRWYMEEVDLYLGQNWSKELPELLTSQRRTYDLVHFAYQFRLVGLFALCFSEFIGAILFGISLSVLQILILSDISFFILLGFLLKLYYREEKSVKFSLDFVAGRQMLGNMVGQGTYQAVVLILLMIFGPFTGLESGRSLIFNVIVWMTLFNAWNSVKWNGEAKIWTGMTGRDPLIYIWILLALCQIVIVQFGGHVFSTVPPTLLQWAISIAAGIGTLLIYQVVIRIPILRKSKNTPSSNLV